jgi:hypothetical protein
MAKSSRSYCEAHRRGVLAFVRCYEKAFFETDEIKMGELVKDE